MRFKFVDHTADIEFIAYGRTEAALFTNALTALFETVADTKALRKAKTKTVRLKIDEKAEKLDELLWYTMQYALSYAESKGVFGYDVASMVVKEKDGVFSCRAEVHAKHKRDEYSRLAAKGIARYEMDVKKGKVMEARVVIDV
jgi:SHS2 domain-containing protein